MMRYFVYKAGAKVGSLRRVDMDSKPVVLERWDAAKKSWVWSPSSVDAVSGFASDTSNFEEISPESAKKMVGKS